MHKYITGIVSERAQKLLGVHSVPDEHGGVRPGPGREEWFVEFHQPPEMGAGAIFLAGGFWGFLVRPFAGSTVIEYIENQPRHHARRSFREEYLRFLKRFEVEHEERFIFRDVDED